MEPLHFTYGNSLYFIQHKYNVLLITHCPNPATMVCSAHQNRKSKNYLKYLHNNRSIILKQTLQFLQLSLSSPPANQYKSVGSRNNDCGLLSMGTLLYQWNGTRKQTLGNRRTPENQVIIKSQLGKPDDHVDDSQRPIN